MKLSALLDFAFYVKIGVEKSLKEDFMKVKSIRGFAFSIFLLSLFSCAQSKGSCFIDLGQLPQAVFEKYQAQTASRGERSSDLFTAKLEVYNQKRELKAEAKKQFFSDEKSILLQVDFSVEEKALVAFLTITAMDDDEEVEIYAGSSDPFDVVFGVNIPVSLSLNPVKWNSVIIESNRVTLRVYRHLSSLEQVEISEDDPFWATLVGFPVSFRETTVIDENLYLFGFENVQVPRRTFLVKIKLEPNKPIKEWDIDQENIFVLSSNDRISSCFFYSDSCILFDEDGNPPFFYFIDLTESDPFNKRKKVLMADSNPDVQVSLLVPLEDDFFFVAEEHRDVFVAKMKEFSSPVVLDFHYTLEKVSSFLPFLRLENAVPTFTQRLRKSIRFKRNDSFYCSFENFLFQIAEEDGEWKIKSLLKDYGVEDSSVSGSSNLNYLFADSVRRGNFYYLTDFAYGFSVLQMDREGKLSLVKKFPTYRFQKLSIYKDHLFLQSIKNESVQLEFAEQSDWSIR